MVDVETEKRLDFMIKDLRTSPEYSGHYYIGILFQNLLTRIRKLEELEAKK